MDKSLILNKIKKHLKIRYEKEFADFLGIKPTTLSMWHKRNTYDAELLFNKCEFLNPLWLLTGKEPMLNTEKEALKPKNLIPLYEDVESIGGRNYVAEMNGISHSPEMIDAGDWFPGVTAAIRHYGDSMTEYPSGCILALKTINNREEFSPGKNYVVETYEDRVTKRMQRSEKEGYAMLYSSNTETYPDGKLRYEPYPIKLKNITRLFLVLGRIVKEHSSGPVYTQ